MASLLKNQIIKHLSKFVKNLSPDKINLSTLRGEGDLTNLELDEKTLTDLLELPSWLALQRAWCNRVSIKIPWTKLKTVPICLNLDEVHVIMETCNEVRKTNYTSKPSYATGGKYGFSDRVVDGLTLRVNSLIITFKSPAFQASLQLSRLLLESCSPTWKPGDLRLSRLKDVDTGAILIFKELKWQNMRLEAKSTNDLSLSPLRLITNQSRCRITIKKKLSDCSVLGCRLVLIMDELLWVLTDKQLSAAAVFLQSLSHLIEKDTLLNQRTKAARKLETLPEFTAQQQQQQEQRRTTRTATALSRVFSRYDVLETSYHFYSEKIDLHFCDDPGIGRASHPDLKDGGALQISLYQLQLDYYPYHWTACHGRNRKHWICYEDGPPARWIQQALEHFSSELLSRLQQQHGQQPARVGESPGSSAGSERSGGRVTQGSVMTQLRQLMSACLIVRLSDFTLYRVSTARSKQCPKEFVAGDKARFSMPDSIPLIHLEYTQFYYPGDLEFPIPQPTCFVQVNPIQVNFDGLTVLWLHAFSKGLEKTVGSMQAGQTSTATPASHVDVRIEALMPRVILEVAGNWDRPRCVHLQASRLICSNRRSQDVGSKADLAACLERIQGHASVSSNLKGEYGNSYSSLCFSTTFPSKTSDASAISEEFLSQATASSQSVDDKFLSRDWLWSKDDPPVWCFHLDPFWADFYNPSSAGNKSRPQAFVGTVPVTLWLCTGPTKQHVLLNVSSLVSVQLDRPQYIFLLRLNELLTESFAFLGYDAQRFASGTNAQSLVLGAVLPQLDVSFIFPPLSAAVLQAGIDGESPLIDTESAFPETSSMSDVNYAAARPSLINGRLYPSSSETMLRTGEQTHSSSGSLNSALDTVLVKSQSDSVIEMSITSESTPTAEEIHEAATGSIVEQQQQQRNVSFAAEQKSIPQQYQPLQSSFSSVKRGLHSFMNTVDAAIKNTAHQHAGEDGSDTMSMRSDGSSDSDTFVLLNVEAEKDDIGHVLFRTTASIGRQGSETELAVEARGDTPTPSEYSVTSSAPPTSASALSNRIKNWVAVVTFHINDVEMAYESTQNKSSVRLQASDLTCNECPAISREEFQSKFSSRSRGWRDSPRPSLDKDHRLVSPFRMRMEQSIQFDPRDLLDSKENVNWKEVIAKASDGFIEVQMAEVDLSMLLSSTTGLAAFFEDEVQPQPMKMRLLLDKIGCTLTEDRPAACSSGPLPCAPAPMKLKLDKVQVERDEHGTLHLGPSSREAQLVAELERLRKENEELRQKLAANHI